MIQELINRFDKFSDSVVEEIKYFFSNQGRAGKKVFAQIIIRSLDRKTDKWIRAKILFEDVNKFRFIENEKICSTVINAALVKIQKENIVFDFFPIFYSQSHLVENDNSDFLIYCKNVSFEILKDEKEKL
jgi:hypothetical protein